MLRAGFLLCVLVSACGARSSLLEVDPEGRFADGSAGSGASNGSGSGGGGGGGGEVLDPGHDDPCGEGLKGPVMVVIPLPDGGNFCIDSTEVTSTQYAAFVAADVPVSTQPPYCAWNDTFVPLGWDLVKRDNRPVFGPNWCQANAYCAWAGKRLCGRIGGGGQVSEAEWFDPLRSEWLYACTAGGTRLYPYGDEYDPSACVTDNHPDIAQVAPPWERRLPVGAAKGCEGGFPGLFDMGGNVMEWDNNGNELLGPTDGVDPRGGSYAYGEDNAQCTAGIGSVRYASYGAVGFRCCKDGPQ